MNLGNGEQERNASSRQWQVAPDSEIFLTHWNNEEETVLYHLGSGDTYLLNDLARRVILILQETPASAIDICDRIGFCLGVISQQEKIKLLENLLTDLLKVDVVRFQYR